MTDQLVPQISLQYKDKFPDISIRQETNGCSCMINMEYKNNSPCDWKWKELDGYAWCLYEENCLIGFEDDHIRVITRAKETREVLIQYLHSSAIQFAMDIAMQKIQDSDYDKYDLVKLLDECKVIKALIPSIDIFNCGKPFCENCAIYNKSMWTHKSEISAYLWVAIPAIERAIIKRTIREKVQKLSRFELDNDGKHGDE